MNHVEQVVAVVLVPLAKACDRTERIGTPSKVFQGSSPEDWGWGSKEKRVNSDQIFCN